MQEVNESIIKKIKALIEKSQQTDSIEESTSFMLGAQKLLQKHNLEESQVEEIYSNSIDGKKNSICEMTLNYYDQWEVNLCSAIGRNNFCDVLYFTHSRKIVIIGKRTNCETALYLYNFFRSVLLKKSIKSYTQEIKEKKEFFKSQGIDYSKLKSFDKFEKQYLENFFVGAVHGVRSKMMKLIEQSKREMPKLNALILHNGKEIEKFIKDKYKKVKENKKKEGVNRQSNAYYNGFEIGVNIEPYLAIDENLSSTVQKQIP